MALKLCVTVDCVIMSYINFNKMCIRIFNVKGLDYLH